MYLIFSVPDGDYMNVSVQLEEDFMLFNMENLSHNWIFRCYTAFPICFVNVAVPFSKLIR